MLVTVRVHGHLVAALGSQEVRIDLPRAITLGSLLDQMGGNAGLGASVLMPQEDALHILVDGQDWRLLGARETPLHDDCIIDLIPPFAGGQGRPRL